MANSNVIPQLRAHKAHPVRYVDGSWWGATISSTTKQLLYVCPLAGHYIEIPVIPSAPRGGRAYDLARMEDLSYQVWDIANNRLIPLSSLGISYQDPALHVIRAPKKGDPAEAFISPWPGGQGHNLHAAVLLETA